MRKTGIGLLVAAYVLALYAWLVAPAHAHATLGKTLIAAYVAPWQVALACALALNGLALALVPIRRGEKWAVWLSAMNLLIFLANRVATDPRCLMVLDWKQNDCHTFMISMVLGLVGLALAAPRQSKARQPAVGDPRNGYRQEKRHPKRFHLQISSTADFLAMESALAENVSSHGLRVQTRHSWKPGTQALVKSPVRELWARARIVYCESLPRNSFALGLEFLTGPDPRAKR